MRKVYLHIGYPKSFSTSLQRSFFEVHPDIAYGGIGIGDNISYANEDIEFTFECLLKYANHSFYLGKKEYARDVIGKFIDRTPKSKAVVFSSEHLIFPFSPQHLDFYETFQRLQQLLEGYEIHFIIVLRDQTALVKSLYGEYVKMGYPETYAEFIRWIWAYRDRNFWDVLKYDEVYEKLSTLFSAEHIHIQLFENFKKEPQQNINKDISELLDISNKKLPIKNDNSSLSKNELKALLELNKQERRGMGNHILTPFENHRNRESLKMLQSGFSNDEIFANVYAKRLALVRAKRTIQIESGDFYKLSPEALDVYNRMKKSWQKSNDNLKKQVLNYRKLIFHFNRNLNNFHSLF